MNDFYDHLHSKCEISSFTFKQELMLKLTPWFTVSDKLSLVHYVQSVYIIYHTCIVHVFVGKKNRSQISRVKQQALEDQTVCSIFAAVMIQFLCWEPQSLHIIDTTNQIWSHNIFCIIISITTTVLAYKRRVLLYVSGLLMLLWDASEFCLSKTTLADLKQMKGNELKREIYRRKTHLEWERYVTWRGNWNLISWFTFLSFIKWRQTMPAVSCWWVRL